MAISDPLGNTTQRTYDGAARLTTQTDPRGKTTRFAYDALNRLTALTDPLGGLTQFTYDGNGNLRTVTDARGSVTTHEYDSMDRLSTRTDPLNRAESFTYDGVGNLVSTTDRKNQTTTFTYDPLNRRTQATYADGATATVTYDAAGRLTLADDTADPHRPIAMAYDALDRLQAETTGLGTVTYQYDTLGRRTQMTVSGQAPVAYAYDAASRPTQLVQEPLAPVTLQYDALGRRTVLTLPNQVSTEYQYDPASRLTALIYRNALGPLGNLTYTYDAAGNRTRVGGTFARTLLPDPVPSASYDAANEQLAFGPNTMAFDANGNLATLTDPTGPTTFTWDVRNRLTALSGPDLTGTFAYDALGRRATREINAQRTQYLYEGVDVIQEAPGSAPVAYLRSLNLDEPLARDGQAFYLTDPLGSAIALTDTNGLLDAVYDYEPFGQTMASGATRANPFQFTGRENDQTGLYYYRARYYHPTLQRFMTEDPLDIFGGELNLYRYAGNNPVVFVDPFGLDKEDCTFSGTFSRRLLTIPISRYPDYVSFSFNFPIPKISEYTKGLVGGSVQFAVDRHGRFYGGIGPQVGKSFFRPWSASLAPGWLLQKEQPKPEQLAAFLTASSFNAGGGYWGGAQLTYVPGVCTAVEAGVFTPQVGGGYHYSVKITDFGFSW